MSALTHGVKKRLSKVTTRNKTIEDNISAAYTVAKKRVQREKKALKDALKLIDDAGAWQAVATSQKEFAELIEAEGPIDGVLHDKAVAAVSEMRTLQADVTRPASTSDAIAKMVGHVKAFIAEIEAIEKDFKAVETQYTEKQRYEKKVSKLSDKENKAEKTKRNMDKLEGSRAALQSILDAIMDRMNKTSGKFEAVLQCAQTAFWLRQDAFVTLMDAKTKEARTFAALVSDDVQAVDVTKAELKPIAPATGTEVPSVAKGDEDTPVAAPADAAATAVAI